MVSSGFSVGFVLLTLATCRGSDPPLRQAVLAHSWGFMEPSGSIKVVSFHQPHSLAQPGPEQPSIRMHVISLPLPATVATVISDPMGLWEVHI